MELARLGVSFSRRRIPAIAMVVCPRIVDAPCSFAMQRNHRAVHFGSRWSSYVDPDLGHCHFLRAPDQSCQFRFRSNQLHVDAVSLHWARDAVPVGGSLAAIKVCQRQAEIGSAIKFRKCGYAVDSTPFVRDLPLGWLRQIAG